MLRDGTYTHLLRVCAEEHDVYVHFVSRDAGKHPTWDGEELASMHLPDHISYHRDGKVHIRHKKGRYSDVPFRLREEFLSIDSLLDLPLLAISFYEQGFSEFGVRIGKTLVDRPERHAVIETCNITFTVVVIVRDLAPTPIANRSIDIVAMPGGFVCRPEDRIVLQGKKGMPLLLVNLNPTWDRLQNELRLFAEGEVSRCKEFVERASNQWTTLSTISF